MIEGLEDIKAAWDNTHGHRNEELAVSLSVSYVEDNPEQFTGFEGRTLPSLVESLDTFRLAGMEDDEWKVQAWLFYKFAPQQIGGTYQPQERVPNNG